MLKDSISRLGYDSNLLTVYHAFQKVLEKETQRQIAKLPEEKQIPSVIAQISKRVKANLKYQKFLSKGILHEHAQNYVKAVAVSNLPFVSYETARIADRQDKFARRIFLTSPWEPRTRLNLEEYRLSRAYFFGVFIRLGRSGKDANESFLMYPCLTMNQKGKCCSQACDPFGHHAFICPTTTKTSDHNHARDIISNMSQAFGFYFPYRSCSRPLD